jgi:hypothetical protein
MNDGHSQEMTQADIATHFVNAVCSCYGWHLVSSRLETRIERLRLLEGKERRGQVKVIQNRLYSWIRQGVHSRDEYEV